MSPTLLAPPPVSWEHMDDRFAVARCAGEFLGYIDGVDSTTFAVFDRDSRLVGRFDEWHAARTALDSVVVDGASRRPFWQRRIRIRSLLRAMGIGRVGEHVVDPFTR